MANGSEVAVGYITLIPKLTTGFGQQMARQMQQSGGQGAQSFSLSFTKGIGSLGVAAGNLIATGVSKAVGAVQGSIGGAISRVDTLNRFPKVMANVGYETEQAQAAITRLSDGIQGLPTTLDGIVGNAQSMIMILGDMDRGVDVALALNDGMLTFGASAWQVDNAVFQLNQMISAGTYDMQSWRSVMESAPGYMDQVAHAILGADKSAMNLREALNSGTVSTDDFLSAIVKLDKEGAEGITAFSEQALTATGGIQTAFTNLHSAVTRNVGNFIDRINGNGRITEIATRLKYVINDIGKAFLPFADMIGGGLDIALQKFDDLYASFQEAGSRVSWALEPIGIAVSDFATFVGENFDGIMEPVLRVIDGVTRIVRSVVEFVVPLVVVVAQAVAPIVTAVAYAISDALHWVAENMDQLLPIVGGVVAGFMAFKGITFVVGVVSKVVKVFKLLRSGALLAAAGQAVLNGVMMLNPFVLIASAIIGLVAAFGILYFTDEDFRAAVQEGWEGLKEWFGGVVEWFQGLPEKIGGFFSSIGETISGKLDEIGNWWEEKNTEWDEDWSTFCENCKTGWDEFWDGAAEKASSAGEVISDAVATFMGWVDTAVETGTEVAGTLWETGWGNILGFLEQYAPEFVGPATFIKETIEGAFETIGTIIDDAKQIIGFGIDAIVSLFTGAKLEFPSIKLPHFSISGSFSLNPPSIPTIGVSWYAKGGIATAPSLVGVGEAGNEAIVPLSGSYMRPFAEAIAESMGGNGGNTIYIDGATYNDTDGINEAVGNFLMRLNRLGVI